MGYDLDQVFLALVNRSIVTTWLVAAVLILRFALRKAPKWTRCLLWALVAVRLMFSLSIPSSWSAFNLVNTPVNEFGEIEYAEYTGEGVNPSVVFERPTLSVPSDAGSGLPVTVETEREYVYLPFLSQLWLAGVGAMLLYALISYLKLRRRVAASIKKDGVWLCDDIESPFILGVFAPRIYVPSGLCEPQLSHVLAHERAHLARHDHWWKPLGFALLTVYWFTPALWLAYILLCKDIELACDERVYRDMAIAERADYSQTLLDQSRPGGGVAACPLAFGEVGVRERVKAALSYKKPAFWVLAVAVAACVVVAVCFLTNPAKLAIDFSRDEIIEAETYHVMTVEDVGLRQLSGAELDVLYERLRDIPNAAYKGDYAGLTPMYTLTFNVPYKGSFQLRGYDDEGAKTEIYFEDWARKKGETWRVKDNEFGRYVMELCKYGTGQIDGLDDFLLVLANAKSISYDPPALSSAAYPFPITDPELLAEVRSVLERVEESDGGPAKLNDNDLTSGSFRLDDAYRRDFFVCDGFLCVYDNMRSVEENVTVLGRMPEGVNLNWVLENAARRQESRGEETIPTQEALTLDGVRALAKKGAALSSRDFDGYAYYETGSGLYIKAYPIDEAFAVLLGFASPDADEPLYFKLTAKNHDGRFSDNVDLDTGDVESFIAMHSDDKNGQEKPRLTLDDVRALSEKGETLTWEDLEGYEYYVTGSGLHSHLYPIDGRFSLTASGTLSGLRSATLYDGTAAEPVDIRNSADLNAFLDSHEKAQSVPFTAVLGCGGHYIDLELAPGFYQRRYIVRTGNNERGLLAESFGFTIDDHVVDLDGDGVTELACNCVSGGDGAQRVYVYRRHGELIERGSIDYGKLNLTAWDNWGVNSSAEWYDPARGVIMVKYASLASSSGDGTTPGTFLREAGFEALAWEAFATVP